MADEYGSGRGNGEPERSRSREGHASREVSGGNSNSSVSRADVGGEDSKLFVGNLSYEVCANENVFFFFFFF